VTIYEKLDHLFSTLHGLDALVFFLTNQGWLIKYTERWKLYLGKRMLQTTLSKEGIKKGRRML
jgi:hypothetical protein